MCQAQSEKLATFLAKQCVIVPGDTFTMGTVFRIPSTASVEPRLMPPPTVKTAGVFEGFANEKPAHKVRIDTFFMGKYEVTVGEFTSFVSDSRYVTTAEIKGYSYIQPRPETILAKSNNVNWHFDLRGKPLDSTATMYPIVHVSFVDIVHYCNWLSEKHGLHPVYIIEGELIRADWQANGFRLPTEAEWEFAAREGGKIRRYGNGKNIADPNEINFDGDVRYPLQNAKAGIRRNKTLAVGSLPPNSLGLYDMSGNVEEWCWDWFSEDYYAQSPYENPKGPAIGDKKCVRGGHSECPANGVRCSDRGAYPPFESYGTLGFRVVKNK